MYLNHFGMTLQPFSPASDPSFIWLSDHHLKSLDQIQLSVQRRKGVVLISGESGVGKTMVGRAFMKFARSNIVESYIGDAASLTLENELLLTIIRDFGFYQQQTNLTPHALINFLYQQLLYQLSSEKIFVVVIDNAHKMSETVLEQIKLLTGLETNTRKLLQLILIGQPALWELLQLPKYQALRKKVRTHIKLAPLSFEETKQYIAHQVGCAGYQGKALFADNTIEQIFAHSGGIPSRINQICSSALQVAYTRNEFQITSGLLQSVLSQQPAVKLNGGSNGNTPLPENLRALLGHYRGWVSHTKFPEILKRERYRSDRTGNPLSFLLINLPLKSASPGEQDSLESFLKDFLVLISENTRDTDLKYVFDGYKIGILLIDTPLQGAKAFIEKISNELVRRLKSSHQIQNIEFIKSITISSYPVNQIQDYNKIKGTPVVLKNLKFQDQGSGRQNKSAGKIAMTEDSSLMFDWHIVPNKNGTLEISTPLRFEKSRKALKQSFFDMTKRTVDCTGALVGIIVFAPLMAIIAFLIKVSSRGPVLFKQTRIGYLGKPFTFLKFRTMYTDSNEQLHKEYVQKLIQGENQQTNFGSNEEPLFKIKDDPRITKIGALLRKSSLDELPQLFNVLMGHMSLVGPRPPLPYEVEIYKSWHYRRILEVPPGITGLWQVEGRSKTTFNDMVRLDLKYVSRRSLLLDLKILFRTIRTIFHSDGAL